jgi:hypothetical protein
LSQRSLAMFYKTRFYKTLFVCLMLVPFCTASDWNYEETHTDARDFVTGGMVHVRLSVGDMHIRRSDANHIRLRYTVKSRRESHVKNAHVDFEIRGRDANIEFHTSTSSNTQIDVELEVPPNTNLDVHEKVGDLTVDEIEGDKELELGVGDIRIAAGRHSYHPVQVSTGIGDVNGDGYGATSGWLGKTLKYHGEGKYELRAHVSVGDINFD